MWEKHLLKMECFYRDGVLMLRMDMEAIKNWNLLCKKRDLTM